jgi:hypothetical protein
MQWKISSSTNLFPELAELFELFSRCETVSNFIFKAFSAQNFFVEKLDDS